MEKASLEESAEASILFFALLCAVQCGVAIRCANERVVSSFTKDVGWGSVYGQTVRVVVGNFWKWNLPPSWIFILMTWMDERRSPALLTYY